MIATREKQPPPCVNLLERFGERYRITFDEAADAHGRQRDKIDPYLQQITPHLRPPLRRRGCRNR